MQKLFFLVSFFLLGQAFAELKPSQFINFNGKKIAVYKSKGHHGPGVLLIHGNTSSANIFEKVLESSYGRKQKLVAIDLPGYGRSENASSYNGAYFAQAIAFAVNTLKLNRGVVVGWSLGGDFALQASALLPHVKGYFLFGTSPVGVDPALPAPFLSPTESYAGAAVNVGFVPNMNPEQITAYVTAFFRPHFSPIPQTFVNDGLRTDPGTRAAVFAAATGQDPTFQDEIAIIRNLAVSVALVAGKKDAFVNPNFLNQLAPSIPNLYTDKIIFVNNTGHAVQWERPAQFVQLLKQFVESID